MHFLAFDVIGGSRVMLTAHFSVVMGCLVVYLQSRLRKILPVRFKIAFKVSI